MRARVGGTPSRSTVRVSVGLAETGRRTGMGAIELRGQGGELGLGDHGGIGVIGPSHPGGDDRAA